jgi:hypothetical protein
MIWTNRVLLPSFKLSFLFLFLLFVKLISRQLDFDKLLFPSHICGSVFILYFLDTLLYLFRFILLWFYIINNLLLIVINLAKVFIDFLILVHEFLNTINSIIVHQDTIVSASSILISHLVWLTFNELVLKFFN